MNAAAAIHNREFAFDPAAPIEVLRAGEFPHSSGITQVVDGLALESILANFAKDKQSPNWPGLLVDFDHFSADVDKPSEAAGWIQDLRREGSSLLAVVDWTGAGNQAVRSGRYRLLSPVFNREEMQDLGNGRLRPARLDSVGLTNSPNMRGLTPISNRSEPENVATLTAARPGIDDAMKSILGNTKEEAL